MASKQIMHEVITRTDTETTRVAIQTMAEAQVERMHKISGPKIGSPIMKQLMLD